VFIDCVENNTDPIVSVKDGINVVKLIDAARDAANKESKVVL
jgi:predicted dehydrogenase